MADYEVDVHIGNPALGAGVYDVMAHGAVGDGTTDDTTAIQAAIDACEAAGSGEVYFPPNTYRTTSTLTVGNTSATEFIHINAGQAVIKADASLAGPIIHLGSTSAQARNIDLTGGYWRMASRDWTDTVGIKLSNLYMSHLRDFMVYGCEKGLELSALSTADGTAYNTIHFRYIFDCKYGIYIENDGSGWCNENTFYGNGSINYSTALADVDCSGGAAFYAQAVDYGGTSTYLLNSITINGMSLEFGAGAAYDATNGHTKPPAMDVDMHSCSLAGIRTEGFDTTYTLTSASNTDPCVLTFNQVGSTPVTDHGVEVGDTLYITGVTANCLGLNGNSYVVEAVSATTVDITVDMSGEAGNGTGGTASRGEWLKFGSNSIKNIFYGGRRSFSSAPVAAASRLRCNFVGDREHILAGGDDGYPVLTLRTNSSGYKAFAVYNATETTPEFYMNTGGGPVFVPRSAPSSPAEGEVYYDSVANKLKVYTGAAWETMTSGSGTVTYKKIVYIENPAAADSFPVLSVGTACTITRITHITDTGTVDWNLEERAEATPGTSGTDVYAADEQSSSVNSVDTSFSNASLAEGSWLHYSASAVASTPTKLWIGIEFTED